MADLLEDEPSCTSLSSWTSRMWSHYDWVTERKFEQDLVWMVYSIFLQPPTLLGLCRCVGSL
jgi:hypothetical protein